jgi:F0F1-type ATP synthase membrane subunit b/b'
MMETLLSLSIISLVCTTLLLGLVLGVVVISYRKILERYYALQKKEAELRGLWAHEREKILEEARDKASQIIREAQVFTAQQSRSISLELENFSEAEKQTYTKILQQIQAQSVAILGTVANEIKDTMKGDFKNLTAVFEKEIIASKDGLKNALENQYKANYEEAKKEIENYKAARLREIDDSASQLISDFSLKVFGHAVTLEDHQNMIVQALEEAKKRHVI